MRATLLVAVAAALLLAPAAATSQPTNSDEPSNTINPPPPPDNGRLLTPQQEGRQGVVKGAAEAPLRDVNLIRSKIPPVLLSAMADPYARPAPGNCRGITGAITPLDEALGPDLDAPSTQQNPSLLARGKGVAGNAALDLMRGAAEGVIPFRSWVRMLTGAEAHDSEVNAAITAGGIRRAYLKGLGEVRGCAPPAEPKHLAHAAEPVVEHTGRRKPQYPIH
ncbi:MAG: hypothetical protein ACHP84_08875 [Caulobacterales bacterium]